MRFTTCIGRVLAVGAVAGGTLFALTTPAAPAQPVVTYTATVNVPVPPASNFAGSGGGDGWAVALSPTEVFNVFHHQTQLRVACHFQSNASPCWSPTLIQDGSGNDFATSIAPGLYLDQGNDHLFVPAVRTNDFTGGVVCIDVSSAGGPSYCGFTALGGAGDSPLDAGDNAGLSDPVQVGNDWYIFNEVAGSSTGTQNKMFCFDLVTDAACAGQPYALNYAPHTFTGFGYSWPMGASGSQLVYQVVGSSTVLGCFNTTTHTDCSGSWPVSVTGADGAPFPLLNNLGSPVGICDPIPGDPCFDPTGASVATPPGMAAAIANTYQYNGTSAVIGDRVYVPEANSNQVGCYDYVAQAGCANFPKSFANLGLLYTVNADPQRPTCLWVNADDGSEQIQNFDAYTGGACGTGAIRVLASSVVSPAPICLPGNWTSLQVTQPARSAYTSGSVTFEDFDGNPLSGIPTQNLDSTGSVNLSGLGIAGQSALPQFLITLVGAPLNQLNVQVVLQWQAPYSSTCIQGTTTAPNPGAGYWLGAGDGGVFAFGQPFHGSMVGQPLDAPMVALAATPDNGGYVMAGADGGVFAFGDAQFEGSLPQGGLLNAAISAMAITSDGRGYWLAGRDGGVFAFGDAQYEGSLPANGTAPGAPIVGIAATHDGAGYWLVDAGGRVYPFGDAVSHGDVPTNGLALAAPIVGMAATPAGGGYWLVGADGGVLTFGDAGFYGSLPAIGQVPGPGRAIVGMAPTADGHGYLLAGADGGVFAFPDATYLGALPPGTVPVQPVVGIAG